MIILLLSVLFLVAAFLRFYRLMQRSLMFWDDGVRLNEVVFLTQLFTFLKQNLRSVISKKVDFSSSVRQFKGTRLVDCNPLSTVTYFAVSKVTGSIEFCGLYTNALAGILGVGGTYFTASVLFGQWVGLASAALLAVSGYHVSYSRSIHKEVISGFFYIWATGFYALSLQTQSAALLFVAAVFVGCAFVCNYRQIHYPFLFVFYEILACFSIPFGFDQFLTRFILLCLGMALPLAAIQQFFGVLIEIGYPYPSYLKQLYHISNNVSRIDLKLPFLKMYALVFIETEGWIFLPLLVFGLWSACAEISLPMIIVLSQFLVPLFFWSARPTVQLAATNWNYSTPRLISSGIYAAVILVALGAWNLPQPFRDLVLAASLIWSAYKSFKLTELYSPYKNIFDWMAKQPGGNLKHITLCPPISKFLVGAENTFKFSDNLTLDNLKQYCQENQIEYLIDLGHVHHFSQGALRQILDQVSQNLKPVYSLENPIKKWKSLMWDEYGSPDYASFSREMYYLNVYKLSDFFDRT